MAALIDVKRADFMFASTVEAFTSSKRCQATSLDARKESGPMLFEILTRKLQKIRIERKYRYIDILHHSNRSLLFRFRSGLLSDFFLDLHFQCGLQNRANATASQLRKVRNMRNYRRLR